MVDGILAIVVGCRGQGCTVGFDHRAELGVDFVEDTDQGTAEHTVEGSVVDFTSFPS